VALGSIVGAFLASKYAKRMGVVFLKNFLLAVVLITASDLLGLFKWIASQF